MSTKPLIIDIILNERFYCQLRYNKRGFPKLIDGRIVETYTDTELRTFIEQQRPSLRGRPYQIHFTTQPLLK